MENDKIYLSTIKTSWMFFDWISEEKEEIICDRFSTGPGDIRRYIETIDWLTYSLAELAKLFKPKKNISILKELRIRIKYGIKKELIELANLKGIGRIRARSLYNKKYHSVDNLDKASIQQLSNVPQIGVAIAKSIKDQLSKLK